MTTIRKTLNAALAAAALSGALIAMSDAASAAPRGGHGHHGHHGRHFGGHGWGWGPRFVGGPVAFSPFYAEPALRCRLVERVNRWGDVIGVRRVCRYR